MTSWQPVGAVGQLANVGDYLTTRIADWRLLVLRSESNTLQAFLNLCPHRGSLLLEGSGNCDKIVCPYHGWQFDLHGTLQDTPWFGEASPFDKPNLSLRPVQLDAWRGIVFVAIAPEQTLEEQLGDIPDLIDAARLAGMDYAHNESFNADCNWKIYIDQFQEFYHTPFVHGVDRAVDIQNYTATPYKNSMLMTAPPESAFFGGRWVWGWPNWTLGLFPGGMKLSRSNPTGINSMETYFHYWFEREADIPQAGREKVISATADIFRQDRMACERVQTNVPNGEFSRGPFHPRHETAVAYFQQLVLNALNHGDQTNHAGEYLDV